MPKTPILPAPTDDNVREWLTKQMKENNITFLLAFADDGVIWGRMDNGSLVIAHETTQKEERKNYTELRGKTLQQAYAFSDKMEVRLFRDELNAWKAWKIEDEGEIIIKESQVLWGDKLDEDKNQPTHPGFMRLLAERKGIPPQIVPIKDDFDATKCVRLEVRHMVKHNDDGEAYVELSRLAGLSVGEKKKNLEVAK